MTVLDRNFTGPLSDNIEDYPQGLVIVADKPYRWTSADVIRKLKFAAIRHFGKKNLKVGHAGTLDPLASGTLIVCVGNACRRAESIQAGHKEYIADICFGAVTASYDLEKPVEMCGGRSVTRTDIEAALPLMTGPQRQIAPLFSAKMVDGVRAYELARRMYRDGLALDEAAEGLLHLSDINISELELLDFKFTGKVQQDSPANGASSRICVNPLPSGLSAATVRISCSKGTYIRSFARDLGERLGTGAFLSSLRRTECSPYRIEDALDINGILALLS